MADKFMKVAGNLAAQRGIEAAKASKKLSSGEGPGAHFATSNKPRLYSEPHIVGKIAGPATGTGLALHMKAHHDGIKAGGKK